MDAVETDLNKNADSANDSVESFEDAIEHLDVSDELPSSIDTKPLLDNDVKSMASLDTLSGIKCLDYSLDEKSDSKVSIDSTVNEDSKNNAEEKEKVISSENASDSNATVVVELPNKSELCTNNDEKSNSKNLDIITNHLADVDINNTNCDNIVPFDSKPAQEDFETKVNLLSVKETPVTLVLEESEVTAKAKAVENTEKTEVSTEVDDFSNVSTNDSKDNLEKETNQDKTDAETNSTVTKDSINEEPSINGDLLPDILKEAQEVTETLDESKNDDNVSNEIIAEPNNSVENEKSDNNLSEEEDEGSIKSEREQGDGQGEQEEVKELELDEDKRNPEYIPKKGSFYEHDTRTMDGFDDDVKKIEEELAAKSKRKPKPVSSEGRWEHDKYNELEQMPKTEEELNFEYGYDIRKEDNPPKARRNRRYGRGPNKYIRSWEDEKAYLKIENKPRTPGGQRGGNRNVNDRAKFNRNSDNEHQCVREEFPALDSLKSNVRDEIPYREDKHQLKSSQLDKLTELDKIPLAAPLHYSDKIGMKAEKGAWVPPPPFSQKNVFNKEREQEKTQVRNLVPKEVQSLNELPVTKSFNTSSNTGISKLATAPLASFMRQRPQAATPPHWYHQKVESTAPPDLPDLAHKDLTKLPGGLSAMRGGKRYSVQRQQSLPDSQRTATVQTATPTVEMETMSSQTGTIATGQTLPTSAYYHHASTGTVPITVPQSSPSHLVFTQSPPPSNPNPSPALIKGDFVIPNMSGETPIFHSNSYQPSSGVHSSQKHHLNNGVPGAPPMLVPVHFVQPPPSQVPNFTPQPPATFSAQPQTGFTNQPQAGFTNQPQANFNNQPQGAPMMSYGPQPIQFQPLQSAIVTIPPQPEVFQPAGGITYYSPQTQAVLQRPTLSKRVKSAIPIVPPSEVQQIPNNMQSNLLPVSATLQQAANALPQGAPQGMPPQLVPLEINQEDPALSML